MTATPRRRARAEGGVEPGGQIQGLRPSESRTAPPGPIREHVFDQRYSLWLTLPYPPSTNHLYRVFQGRAIKSAEGRAYFERVREEVWMTLTMRGGIRPPKPLRLTVELHPPDARRRDADGPIKCLQDAVFAGLGVDDSVVSELHVYRMAPDRQRPRAEVLLESLEGE